MFIDLHPKFDSILIDILISTIDMAYVLYDSSLLRKLYKTASTSFSQKDKNGQYILHRIAPYADEASILYCIDQYPKALEIYDKHGMLAIHLALLFNPPNEEAARVMIYKNPAIGLACDNKGRTISDIRGKHSDSLWNYTPAISCCFPWGFMRNIL